MAQPNGRRQTDLRGLSGKEAEEAFKVLRATLKKGAQQSHLMLNAPGAPKEGLDAFWRVTDAYWVTFDDQGARHRCCYGVVNPATQPKQTMLCQLNVQPEEPWKLMGAFATDDRTHAIYYVHNGKLSHRTNFAQRYPGQKVFVYWGDRSPTPYFVVAKLGENNRTAASVGDYIKAIARFKSGGALEETYRSEFELGLADTIQELEVRVGGADTLPSGIQVGPLTESQKAAKEKLAYLHDLEERLRFDPYLLAGPVDRITESVQADLRRRLQVSIGAAVLSILSGWVLSGVSPADVIGTLHSVYGALAGALPWLPH